MTMIGAPVAARLDAIDRQILKELQDDGRMTNVELARRVGISAPPCLRRVRALEQAGYIKGYRALLDEKRLGYEVTVFAMVHLTSQADADLKAFEDFVRAQPLVRECWMLSGEIDFVLKCVAPDLKTFQAFVAELTAAHREIESLLAGDVHGSNDVSDLLGLYDCKRPLVEHAIVDRARLVVAFILRGDHSAPHLLT
jgi:DNA-binding Lrp family transcriptional regulator